MVEISRHLEDLDDHSRRHNNRLQGLPEAVTADQLEMALLHIFNDILDRPLVMPIDMERFHCLLKPRETAEDPPRDVVCCLVNYSLEDILCRAREKQQLLYHDAPIQQFQDLSATTPAEESPLTATINPTREAHTLQVELSLFPDCDLVGQDGFAAAPSGSTEIL